MSSMRTIVISVLSLAVFAAAKLSRPCLTPSVGVFIFHDDPSDRTAGGIGDSNIDYLQQCIANIAAAKSMLVDPFELPVQAVGVQERPLSHCKMDSSIFRLDVYLGFSTAVKDAAVRSRLKDAMLALSGVTRVIMSDDLSGSNPARSFFDQLLRVDSKYPPYDFVFKVHTNMERRLMKHSVECLCGTPSHVISVVQGFLAGDKKVDLLAAQGVVLARDTPADKIAPFLLESNSEVEFRKDVNERLTNMQKGLPLIFERLLDKRISLPIDKQFLIEGSVYWMRYRPFRVEELKKISADFLVADVVASNKATGSENSLLAYDAVLPTLSTENGRVVATMIPAPKIMPLYFPQYHSTPENDRFWSVGFTEWTLLKPLDLPVITKPLPPEKGGLGYYNLTERDIRLKQGVLNKQYGGHGFVYYHYWFTGEGAPPGHKVLYKIPELMLLDGEPNVPFMFSWANEPWTRRWSGKTKDTMLAQDYGREMDWVEHFEYLLPFFKHKNYIRINGSPVFILYRPEHMGRRLQPMLKLWNRMAIDAGIPAGINFVGTIGNFFNEYSEKKMLQVPELKAFFQFWPMLTANYPDAAYGVDINMSIPQYWGSFTGFDPRPRRPQIARRYDINPMKFEYSLKALTNCSDVQRWKSLEDNFVFITAWNEWNEQAILEPSTLYGNGFLCAMRNALQTVPFCPTLGY